MRGMVFQTSARTMIQNELHWPVSGALSPASQPMSWLQRSAS